MPLREEGAVAAKTITSTSASASFLLSASISWTMRRVESASTLLKPMRVTCSVKPGGNARQNSGSCTEFDEGTRTPIRRNSSRRAIANSSPHCQVDNGTTDRPRRERAPLMDGPEGRTAVLTMRAGPSHTSYACRESNVTVLLEVIRSRSHAPRQSRIGVRKGGDDKQKL